MKKSTNTFVLGVLLVITMIIATSGCTSSSREGTIIVAKNLSQSEAQQQSLDIISHADQKGLVETQEGPHIFGMAGKIALSSSSNMTASSSDGRVKIIVGPAKILNNTNGKYENGFEAWLHKEPGIGNVKVGHSFIYPNGGGYLYYGFSTTPEDMLVDTGRETATDMIMVIDYEDLQRASDPSITGVDISDISPLPPISGPKPITAATPSPPVVVKNLFN
jgi:hypothetical protein